MPLSAGLAAADKLLSRLLDRLESQPARVRRVVEALPSRSWMSEDFDDLYGRLKAARGAGAVELEMGKRESAHLIEKVSLVDPGRLYAFVGRVPRADTATVAMATIRASLPPLAVDVSGLLDDLEADWRVGKSLGTGLATDDIETVRHCIRAVSALSLGAFDNLDLRTFSRRATGDSKFVEGNRGRIVDLLRRIRDIPDELDAEEVMAAQGIVRYPQPCLVAGAVTYAGRRLPTEPYIGVAPEMVPHLGVDGAPPWLLTVENLASFNRQVREIGGGVVIYTGGFPSDAALGSILTLAAATTCPIYHWGDIDGGGVKIAYRIEYALARIGRPLHLHLMDPDVALRHGQPTRPAPVFRKDVSGSVVAGLSAFLASDGAHTLEQEELDPIAPWA